MRIERNRPWAVALVAVGLMVAGGPPCLARDYYVKQGAAGAGTEQAPFGDIDQAAALMQAGDTCYVMDGTYSKGVDAYQPNAAGTKDARISFRAYKGQRPVIKGTVGVNDRGGRVRDYVTWSGFVVDGTVIIRGSSSQRRVKGFELAHCEVKNGAYSDDGNWTGVFLNDAEDAWIHDNDIHHIFHVYKGRDNGAGLRYFNARRTVVENNFIHDNTDEGVFDKQGGEDNVWRRNVWQSNKNVHIKINNQPDNVTHIQNVRTRIYENVFIGGGPACLPLVNASDVAFYNNTVLGTTGIESATTQNPGLRAFNNILVGPGGRASSYIMDRFKANLPAYSDHNLFVNARFEVFRYARPNANPPLGDGEYTVYNSLDAWRAAFPQYDRSSVSADPMLVNPLPYPDGDYHLKPGSPARKSGVSAAEGLAGQPDAPRTPGPIPDMGAYPRGEDGTVIGPSPESPAFPRRAAAAAPPSPTPAGPTVKIGALDVPANCALARNEHPRLLFTKADLPDIRRRIAQPGLMEVYDRLKKTVDDQLARGLESSRLTNANLALVPLGLLYHITGEEKYGQACRQATLKAGFGVYATEGTYGYDLCYDLLTPEERRACEEKMLKFVKQQYSESPRLTAALGLYGSGLEEDTVARTIVQLQRWVLNRRTHLNEWALDRGGDGNSHCYIGQHEYVGTMGALQAWRAATGEDLFQEFLWAKTMAPYYVYHYVPSYNDTVNIGINSWGGRYAPIETGAENFPSIAQAIWRCGFTGWWVKNIVAGGRQEYDILGTHWGPILWYDPAVPDIARDRFPEDMLFKTRGYLCMRSDWSRDATFVHFHCGRFETDGRNNGDNNSFILYRKAHLACDTGTRGANNPEVTKYSDGKHHDRYFSQTLAHNSITVGTANIESDPHVPLSRSLCGGQVSRVPMAWLKRYGLPETPDNRFDRQAGTIPAYETSPEFCYAVGDARNSYSPDAVTAFTRQFLYVRPGAVVIFDRVGAVKPEDPKRWYLHTMEQPQCTDGGLRPDPTVHPEGHFLANGRTLRTPHGGSALFSRTVLPEKAIVRVLGGKGHQFEVEGENYDMNDLWWKEVGTPQYQERIGLGWWRVEVEPEVKQADDLFLHVLWATDDTAEAMFPVQKIEKAGEVGVRFEADGAQVEVTFATTGPVGGHIKLVKAGKTVCDRALASRVEDNYQKWQADPRFREWMTNPAMRAVIGDKEQDAYKAAR